MITDIKSFIVDNTAPVIFFVTLLFFAVNYIVVLFKELKSQKETNVLVNNQIDSLFRQLEAVKDSSLKNVEAVNNRLAGELETVNDLTIKRMNTMNEQLLQKIDNLKHELTNQNQS